MRSLRSSVDLAQALAGPMDPVLRDLLTLRRDQWLEDQDVDLADLVHIIIGEPEDTLSGLEAEAGVPLSDPATFEFIERHNTWIEAVLILSDEGFGLALFLPAVHPNIDRDLLRLLSAA